MNQLKLATTKAKEGLFDEAIEILLFAYQSGISSEADILKVLPYYQKACSGQLQPDTFPKEFSYSTGD
ncbi:MULTISPECIES: hypothetical protein [Pseudoalteromonas]|uniref:hypothetical protein n=1 Tax=Pseudoalteromonas TaxID=53246 RepID=UPI0003084F5B|nr:MULTISPECIES: hypothetical protein [Pseudoalteromonas]